MEDNADFTRAALHTLMKLSKIMAQLEVYFLVLKESQGAIPFAMVDMIPYRQKQQKEKPKWIIKEYLSFWAWLLPLTY